MHNKAAAQQTSRWRFFYFVILKTQCEQLQRLLNVIRATLCILKEIAKNITLLKPGLLNDVSGAQEHI